MLGGSSLHSVWYSSPCTALIPNFEHNLFQQCGFAWIKEQQPSPGTQQNYKQTGGLSVRVSKSQWFDSCFGHWDPVRSGHHGLWTNALQRSLTDLDRISSFQGITQCSGLDFLCLDLNPPKLVSWFMYFYRLIDCSGKKHTKWACQGHPLTVRLINMHNSGAPVLRTLICNWKRRTLDREIFKDMFFLPIIFRLKILLYFVCPSFQWCLFLNSFWTCLDPVAWWVAEINSNSGCQNAMTSPVRF